MKDEIVGNLTNKKEVKLIYAFGGESGSQFVGEGYCPPEDIKIIDITTTGGYKIRPYRLII